MPTELIPLGKLKGLDSQYGEPRVYLCTEFEGNPKCKSPEMEDPFWIGSDDIPDNLFQPFEESILMLENADISTNILENNFTNNGENDIIKLGIRDDSNDKSGSGHWISIGNNDHPVYVQEGETNKEATEREVESKESERKGKQKSPQKSKSGFTANDYEKAASGVKTSDGKICVGIRKHGMEKALRRDVWPSKIADALKSRDTEPGNIGDRTVYKWKGLHVVYENSTNEVVSAIYKGKDK